MNSVLLPAGADLQALHAFSPQRYAFLLQSTAAGAGLGNFDMLLLASDQRLQLAAPGGVLTGEYSDAEQRFLSALDRWWRAEREPAVKRDWPFAGGWFLYLGYELAGEIEPGLRLQPDPLLPAAVAVRCEAAIVYSHQSGETHLVYESGANLDPAVVQDDIAAARAATPPTNASAPLAIEEEPAAEFLAAVRSAKRYIAAGDIYQANLSRGWAANQIDADPNRIYQSLCDANPGPFAGLINLDGVAIVSSSPERLLRIHDGIAATRPIAGTRPRSENLDQDQQLLDELINDPKERAEHVMLIDLERNDLGRVCRAGTVTVDEMMIVESYAHVHHIVSNVRGELRPEVTPGEAIAAVFPGGTITGCPKVRCMQIISELESGPRGAYTGSFGYLNKDGSLDLNILIRTLVIAGEQITLRAGSGIVADSNPGGELKETRAKAKGLIRALTQ